MYEVATKLGTASGLNGLVELYVILRDHIKEKKFFWRTFYSVENTHGARRIFGDLGDALRRSLLGDTEFCGSTACVAGWACATHAHLLRWNRSWEQLELVSSPLGEYHDGRVAPYNDGIAFAEAFGITKSQAGRIVFGCDGLDEDQKEEIEDDKTAEKRIALKVIAEVLGEHGIDVESLYPRPEEA